MPAAAPPITGTGRRDHATSLARPSHGRTILAERSGCGEIGDDESRSRRRRCGLAGHACIAAR